MGYVLFVTVRAVEATLVYLLLFVITRLLETPIPGVGSPIFFGFLVLWPVILRPILRPGLSTMPIVGDLLDLLNALAHYGLSGGGKARKGPQCPPRRVFSSDEDIREGIASSKTEDRQDALSAAAATGNQGWIGDITPLLDDQDEFVRIYAANALGTLADNDLVPLLMEKRLSVEEDVRFHFDEAVARIQGRSQQSSPTPPGVVNAERANPQPDRAVEVGRGVLFIGFAKASFMVFGALQKFLLARVVNVAEYGAFSVVNNAISIVNNTIVQGTIQSVSKFTAEDDTRAGAVQRAGLRLQAFLGLGVALAVFLAAPLVAGFVKAPQHTSLFRLAAAIPAIYAFYTVFVGTANGQRRFNVQASFDVGFSISKTILLLAGAAVGRAMGHSVAGAFTGFIAAAVLIMLVAGRKMWLAKGSAQFSAWRLLFFMGGALAYTLLINLALSYDSLLLRRFAGAALAGPGADALVGAYEAVRSLALLPYQALLVVTFVIFPLVSRSTFAEDREATAAYVRQTLRYALIFGAAMAVVLGARPETLLGILYPAAYGAGAAAMPILAAGVVALALLSIAGSIVTASGRPYMAMSLVAVTLIAGTGLAFTMVPRAAAGPDMLLAAAVATAVGMLVGFVVALMYLRRRFGAGLPLASALRVVLAVVLAILVGRVLPGTGKVAGLVAMTLAGIVYIGTLLLAREFGPSDREKFLKILRRKRG